MTTGEAPPLSYETSGLREPVTTLILAVWMFMVCKQKGFALKPLHMIPKCFPPSFPPLRKSSPKLKKLCSTDQRMSCNVLMAVTWRLESWKEGQGRGERGQAGRGFVSLSLRAL